MIAPIKWLKDFVDIDYEVKDFCDLMTMTGTKVEGYGQVGEEISRVVTGKILTLRDHPNSDHLKIASVDVKNQILQIVTGAPNVQIGQIIPIALDNATLPKKVTIKKGKLRGELSEGMMCSIQELNLTKHDYPDACDNGIWVLKEDTPLGMDIKEYAGLDDYAVEFEITPNRQDCYSIKGIAREASVALKKPFKDNAPIIKEEGQGIVNNYIKVNIDAEDLCSRYCARIITDVNIKPSPEWMRIRLRNAGVRPINNIVDITNYVMLELGQPMHAFDLEYIEGNTINVRRAKPDEKVVMLDEKTKILDDSILVISDTKKAVAVAGIMGAMNSEVNSNTKTVLFESAMFSSSNVRISAKKLGMRTDSSSLFEKGLDANNALYAINRACELVEILNAGKVVKGIVDVNNNLPVLVSIKLDNQKVNNLLGADISLEEMKAILTRLGMKIDKKEKDYYVTVPTYRPDITCCADIAEEVARFYGYNKIIPSLSLGQSVTQGVRTHSQNVKKAIHNTLISCGLNEIMTYSFISPKNFDKLGLSQDDPLRDCMKIKNPLGEDYSVMRTTTLPSMLKVMSYNVNRNIKQGRFFEISKTYHQAALLAEEKEVITIGLFGSCDFYDLKGFAENILLCLGINNAEYVANRTNNVYHTGRCADILLNDKIIGTFGQIDYSVSAEFDAPEDSYILTMDVAMLIDNTNFVRSFRPLPKYPSSSRDLSIIVDRDILSADIIKTAKNTVKEILEDVALFDVYTGGQIEEGSKSLSYSFTFRSKDRTLEEDEVNKAMDKIMNMLLKEYQAKVRC
ncbi:MAG TPA: phenylalanine--tRNA ligase subunit beta [Clostridia bacterium]|nr:phenylalanine--tRNA ligase subunit beta [Clostridia bacterium]